MGTEILRPQDCLIERITVPRTTSFSRRNNFYRNPVPVQQFPNHRSKNPAERAEQRRPELAAFVSRRSSRSSSDDLMKADKVTILRRGEPMRCGMKKAASDGRLERFGPAAPTVVPKEARILDLRTTPVTDIYAGSAFSMSPEPSSLPLPSFSRKKQGSRSFDDSATRDLRRLLRLD